jgi:multidrug efflux system membrane fusion protein
MKAAEEQHHPLWGRLVSIAIIAVALLLAFYVGSRQQDRPWTDDASIDADVVHVAAEVGGRIIALPVSENSVVRKGDLLFQIDPYPYQLKVAQAQADLNLSRAELATRQRTLSTQRSAVVVAGDQRRRALADQSLAARTVERLRPLADQGYIPRQQLDQAETNEHDAISAVAQATEQQAAAARAVDTEAAAEAAVRAGEATLADARRALANTTVRATQDGRVVGLNVKAGEIVAPSQALFTLIATDEWFAMANFRETELRHVKVGECATVYSMIDRGRPMRAHVQGIGTGVLDGDSVQLPRSLPYVEKSVNWVRVAQRFPVRLRIEQPPADLVRLGASAVVEIGHGSACR